MMKFEISTCSLLIFFLFAHACGEKNTEESAFDNQSADSATGTSELHSADLRQAALNGNIDLVKDVIDQGIDVQEPDELGRTALMFASYNGHTEIVRFLTEEGGRIDETNSEGRTPLMFAASGPFPETVEFLLSEGADPNTADSVEYWTPLMYAAAEGNREVVELLLEHGADTSLEDKDGEKAVDFAIQNGHSDVVTILEQ